MTVSLRESVQRNSDPRNLDASVEEVFRLMLGVECHRDGIACLRGEGVGNGGRRIWRSAKRRMCLPFRYRGCAGDCGANDGDDIRCDG